MLARAAHALTRACAQVSPARKVRVTIPRGVRAGDQMKARAPDGSTFVFTVPEGVGEPVWWNPLRTSVIDIAVPRVHEGSADEADAASASTIRVRVPQTWDGEALLAVAHRGREMLVQVPAGAARGDELLLDLPGRRKLKLKLRVPQDHRPGGNDEASSARATDVALPEPFKHGLAHTSRKQATCAHAGGGAHPIGQARPGQVSAGRARRRHDDDRNRR